MKVIQRNTSFRFYLPEHPHIPEKYLRRFYNELIFDGKPLKEEVVIE